MQIPWTTIGKRILAVIPILLGVTFLVVLATDLIPGSPAESLSSKGAFSPEQIAEIEARLGWDDPLIVRYVRYVGNVFLRFDFGESFFDNRPVGQALIEKVPATAELTLAAMAIALVLGVTIGIIAALRPFTAIDTASMVIALCGVSFPVFWLGLILQITFFPSIQRMPLGVDTTEFHWTGFYLIDTLVYGNPGDFGLAVKHLILPASALATIPLAIIARMTRASMMEVLSKDYIRTAKAKGLAGRVVVIKHALRNALIPVVTVAGLQLASLLGGAVLTETVFEWPGLGQYIYVAATKKDLPALQGSVLFVAMIFTMINLAVDLSYSLIDPRIRREGER